LCALANLLQYPGIKHKNINIFNLYTLNTSEVFTLIFYHSKKTENKKAPVCFTGAFETLEKNLITFRFQ